MFNELKKRAKLNKNIRVKSLFSNLTSVRFYRIGDFYYYTVIDSNKNLVDRIGKNFKRRPFLTKDHAIKDFINTAPNI